MRKQELKYQPVIDTPLDTDLYILTMQQAICRLYPRAWGKFKFILRDYDTTPFPNEFHEYFEEQLRLMDSNITKVDAKDISKLRLRYPFFDPVYLELLSNFRFNSKEVSFRMVDGFPEINIEGPLYRAIMWEPALMAVISEGYFQLTGQEPYPREKRRLNNMQKADVLIDAGAKFADFGTRRRFSKRVHSELVKDMAEYAPDNFVGTSNVKLALDNDVRAIGTHAHLFFQFMATKYGYKRANKEALDKWVAVYRGDLGIALTDTFTTDVFLRCFDKKLAKLFDGVRHDSGDPLEFADKIICHYENLGIDPMSKTIIFSDGLTVDRAAEINRKLGGRIKCSFGIGTRFTNDVGVKPLNMVIKLWEASYDGDANNMEYAIKLSDVPGKHSGDEDTIRLAKDMLKIK